MPVFNDTPHHSGGGLSGLMGAISLWDQFREGGLRDQAKEDRTYLLGQRQWEGAKQSEEREQLKRTALDRVANSQPGGLYELQHTAALAKAKADPTLTEQQVTAGDLANRHNQLAFDELKLKPQLRGASSAIGDFQFGTRDPLPADATGESVEGGALPQVDAGIKLFSELHPDTQRTVINIGKTAFPQITPEQVASSWNANVPALGAPRVQPPEIVGQPNAKFDTSVTSKPGELPQATFKQQISTTPTEVFDPSDKNKRLGVMVGEHFVPGKADEPKALGETELQKFSQLYSMATDALPKLRFAWDQVKGADGSGVGPFVGRLRISNPYDVDVKKLNALADALVPGMARGLFGEVGVLTDKDVARYRSLIGDAKSPANIGDAMIQTIEEKMKNTLHSSIDVYKAAGRDVSGLETLLKTVSNSSTNNASGAPQKFGSAADFQASGAASGYVPAGATWKLIRRDAAPAPAGTGAPQSVLPSDTSGLPLIDWRQLQGRPQQPRAAGPTARAR
jgi:hypothetical protein